MTDERPRRNREASGDELFADVLPTWFTRFDQLDPTSQRAWDERVRRIEAGTATKADLAAQAAAKYALEAGTEYPDEARAMPGPELAEELRTWHPDTRTDADRAVALGIPPLIAELVVSGRAQKTRSTKACDLVGVQYTQLVLIGSPGCGKSFAAAMWLWRARHRVPGALRWRSPARRYVESPQLGDMDPADRARLGAATALVLDDAGTERDTWAEEVARVLVARYRNDLATVVTTNLSERDFGSRYGQRVLDRLRETGRFVVGGNSVAASLRGK